MLSDAHPNTCTEASSRTARDRHLPLAGLYRSHSLPLRHALRRRFLGARCGLSPHEIDDAVQETFLRVLQHWARCASASPAELSFGYLMAVARNVCIDLLRRREHQRELLADVVALDRDRPDNTLDVYAEARERCSEARAYFAALPPEWQAVFQARFCEGLSQQASARNLGLTRRQVRAFEDQLRTLMTPPDS